MGVGLFSKYMTALSTSTPLWLVGKLQGVEKRAELKSEMVTSLSSTFKVCDVRTTGLYSFRVEELFFFGTGTRILPNNCMGKDV